MPRSERVSIGQKFDKLPYGNTLTSAMCGLPKKIRKIGYLVCGGCRANERQRARDPWKSSKISTLEIDPMHDRFLRDLSNQETLDGCVE